MQGNVTGNGQRAEAAKKIGGLDSKGRLFQWADELVELVNQLCAEYESWCEEQKVPYIRMDDQDAKGYYLTQAQRAELATFRERWNALDQAQVDSRNRSTSMKLPKFQIVVTETYTNTYEVEAEDEDQAINAAATMSVERSFPQGHVERCNRTIAIQEKA
mgnify:CR=1 FL=1